MSSHLSLTTSAGLFGRPTEVWWNDILDEEGLPLIPQFYPAQLCLLALGFLGPQKECIEALNVKQDPRSNVVTPAGVSRIPYWLMGCH